MLPAKNLLDLRPQTGPPDRPEEQQRITRVNAELEAGVALGDAVRTVRENPGASRTRSPGFFVEFGAEVEQQAKAFQQLQVLLVLGILLVYAVMPPSTSPCATPSSSCSRCRWPRSGGRRPEADSNVFQSSGVYRVIMLAGSWS